MREEASGYHRFEDERSAEDWAFKNFKRWATRVSEERLSLQIYQNARHREINRYLRGSDDEAGTPEIRDHIRRIDRAISKGELKRDIILYRRIDTRTADIFSEIGQERMDAGFTSASLWIGGTISKEKPNALLAIQALKGTRAAYLNLISEKRHFDYQQEILLARNSWFRTLGTERQTNGERAILLEIIHADG